MSMAQGVVGPVIELDAQEQKLLSLAYAQMLVVKALLFYATKEGKRWLAPVPAMIVVAIVKAVYKNAYGNMPSFLPQNRLDHQYPHYPREIFREEFWWDREMIVKAQEEILVIPDIPEAMRTVVTTLLSENSVLHPNGLMGMRVASWWPMRPCSPRQENLQVYLYQKKGVLEEAVQGLDRLGSANAQWCREIGTIMADYMDCMIINGRCGECHSTL